MCSMENRVRDHFRKLSEKHIGRPFFKQPGSTTARMSFDELGLAMAFLDQHFVLLRHEHDQVLRRGVRRLRSAPLTLKIRVFQVPDIDWVLSRAREAVMRYGIRGLVIDPYNELEHQRDHGRATETEYVSNMLSKVKRFAQLHSVHVWFVAHPRQLHNWRDEVPSLYDIAGSAHFVNKADNGIVVHRYRSAENAARKDEVEIHMLKARLRPRPSRRRGLVSPI